jgi:hypothetical protein
MIKLVFFTVFLATAAWAQPPAGTGDFLPLAVGNRWVYSYFREAYAYTDYYSDRVDSGRVEVTVTGVSAYPASNLWHLQETADYRTRLWQHSGGEPAQDSIVHSQVLFDVQEVLTGQHMLTNFGGSWIFRFVFPYDTTVVYRYAAPDTLDLKLYSPPTAYNAGAAYKRSLVLRAAVGVDSMGNSIKYSSSSGNVSAARLIDHTLVPAAVSQDRSLPGDFSLEQNYPNPFNPSTTIRFALPKRSRVKLTVFNTLGQQVARLLDSEIDTGVHDVLFDAGHLASGPYFYRITAGDFSQTRMLLLVR